MQAPVLAVGVLLVCGGALLTSVGVVTASLPATTTPVELSEVGTDPDLGGPTPPLPAGDPAPGFVGPELNAAQEIAAVAALSEDESFVSLFGDAPYTVDSVGPWTFDSSVLLGATMDVTFAHAVDVDGEWPAPDWARIRDLAASPPLNLGSIDYPVRQKWMSVTGLTRLLILMDLRPGRVQVVYMYPAPAPPPTPQAHVETDEADEGPTPFPPGA